MLIPIVLSLALSATADLAPARGFCAFPATERGDEMLQVALEPGADRDRPRSRDVWVEVGGMHRIRGRMLRASGEGGPDLVIMTEDLAGELTIALSADGAARLVLLPEGREAPIAREGRCGGVSSLLAVLARG